MSKSHFKRATAYKLDINEIINGKFSVIQSGEFNIPYVETSFGLFANRVRVFGDVTTVKQYKDETESVNTVYLVINDGTGAILVKTFGSESLPTKAAMDLQTGDMVDVVGKIKKKEDKIHIKPEFIRKVTDPNAEILRNAEKLLVKKLVLNGKLQTKPEPPKDPLDDMEDMNEFDEISIGTKTTNETATLTIKILEVLEKISDDDGSSAKEINSYLNTDIDKVKTALKILFEDGSIYEPKDGHYKVL